MSKEINKDELSSNITETSKLLILKEPKEFYQTKNALENTMHLFVLYDDKNLDEFKYWENYLINLLKRYDTFLKISICSNNEKNKNLFPIFLSPKNPNQDVYAPDYDKMELIKDVQFPCIALAVPHHTESIYSVGITPMSLYTLIDKFYNFFKYDFQKEKEIMFNKIKKILEQYPIICFIKGTPNQPYCKFSKKFVEILSELKVKYKAINIFEDEKLRSYLRFYQGWKTYPQLYINGKIIGGVDKLTELVENKKIFEILPKEN